MNIKLDFGDGLIREYTLSEELASSLLDGKNVSFEVCHPDTGEVFLAKDAGEVFLAKKVKKDFDEWFEQSDCDPEYISLYREGWYAGQENV